jgi:hypothetical protein
MASLQEKKLGQKISCYNPFKLYKVNGSETEKQEAKRCETKKGVKRKHAKFYFLFFREKKRKLSETNPVSLRDTK